MNEKEIHEGDPPSDAKGQKRYPRRATKDYEGPLRGWRKLKRNRPKVGKREENSTRGAKGSVKRAKDESAKGFQGVGIDSKAVREGPRRTLRFPTNAHSIIEPFRFLCRSVSACWNPELPPGGLSFKPKFLTHRQDNSFIFNHHSGILGCVAWEHPDELEGSLL